MGHDFHSYVTLPEDNHWIQGFNHQPDQYYWSMMIDIDRKWSVDDYRELYIHMYIYIYTS